MELSPEQIIEINQTRENKQQTLRACVPALEEILYEAIPVLDNGFVRVIDYMGDDQAIVQAARVSYGTGTKKASNDRGLIRYLMRHRHTTPFEMCELKLHVKLPIFVARQWIRHRTANVNEYSARYSILDNEFYVPDNKYLASRKAENRIEKTERDKGQADLFPELEGTEQASAIAAQTQENKQGRDDILDENEAIEAINLIRSESKRAYTNYLKLLNEEGGKVRDSEKKGLARELARMVLPSNIYTQWYWKIDLHNLLHFLSLRADKHAQYEIRVYAEKISEIVARWVPMTWGAFEDYQQGGTYLSDQGLNVVKHFLNGNGHLTQEESGMSKREWRELMEILEQEL